jgi:hypothetical protein
MLIQVWAEGPVWRLRSSDGLIVGTFSDRRTAVRCAQAEAEQRHGTVLCFEASERLAA